MAQPLLNLKDAADEAPKTKKKPFSRPRKDAEGAPIIRAVAKKPKEPKQPAVVEPDVPEKKSQKRKCKPAAPRCDLRAPCDLRLQEKG